VEAGVLPFEVRSRSRRGPGLGTRALGDWRLFGLGVGGWTSGFAEPSDIGAGGLEPGNAEIADYELTALATALVVLLRRAGGDPRLEAERRIEVEILRFRTEIWIYLMLVTRGVARGRSALLRSACAFGLRFVAGIPEAEKLARRRPARRSGNNGKR
jgi:hypothetical protein